MPRRTTNPTVSKPHLFRNRALTRPRGRLWSAVGVLLATTGCAPPGPVTSEAALESMRFSVDVGRPVDASISYVRAGSPIGTRLVLVHGTPGSASGWADYLVNPPQGMEVVALDRPGFGHSGPDGAVTGLEAQAAAVVALFPADGRPVVLLGHSLGGPVVARVAASHPTRVTAVVLMAASIDPGQESIHPMQRVGDWAPIRGLLPRAIRNANAELMALKPELEALVAWLPLIKAKVVIVHGTKDDLVPVGNVPFMQSHLTGSRCVKTVLLEGRNHFLPWNSADAVRDAVRLAMEEAC